MYPQKKTGHVLTVGPSEPPWVFKFPSSGSNLHLSCWHSLFQRWTVPKCLLHDSSSPVLDRALLRLGAAASGNP